MRGQHFAPRIQLGSGPALGLGAEQLRNPRPYGPARPVTITLLPGHVRAFDGCNRGSGATTTVGGRLHLRGWGQTVAGCGPSREPLSDAQFRLFDAEARLVVTEDGLRVEGVSGTSVFRALPED